MSRVAPARSAALQGNFQRLAWVAVGFTVLVILWGAVVRATGSGAGCGSHWPLCNGEVVPPSQATATVIEYSHRLTSGLAGLLVLVLFLLAWTAFERGSRVRRAAAASLVLIVIEALIGAGLVVFGLVEDDASVARAVYMGGHLLNTLLLVAALTLTAVWAGEEDGRGWSRPPAPGLPALSLLGLLASAITGAVTALGDTVFPKAELAATAAADAAVAGHFLVRLRVFHPLIAVLAALALLVLARRELEDPRRTRRSTALAQALMAAVLAQTAGGVLNIALAAPVWMQIVHLALANAVWIAFVLLADSQLSRVPAPAANPIAVRAS